MRERAWQLGLYVVVGVSLAFFVLPLLGLAARSPWSSTWELLASSQVRSALALSLVVSGAAVLLCLALGFPLAWLLARRDFPGRNLVRTLVSVPMVLPPVVAGVGLLAAFGRRGLLGEGLDALGIVIPFSTLAAVIAAAFVAAPFLVTTLEAGIAQAEPRLEEIAATLGASRGRIFRTVLLPAIRPSLLAAIPLCWARALGEFGATITFAGNLEGRTQTVPLAIYQILQTRPERAFLLGAILLLTSLLVLAALRGRRLST